MSAQRESVVPSKKKIKFSVEKDRFRHIEVENGVSVYHLYPTLSEWVGRSIPDSVNPRSHDEDAIRGAVPAKIESTIRDFPQDFYLANRGLTVLADSVKYDPEAGVVSIVLEDYEGDDADQGVADGGTTDAVIWRVQAEALSQSGKTLHEAPKNSLPKFLREARVHIEVVVGLQDRDRIARLVEGRNTSRAVKSWTINDFRGSFDWIKEILEAEDSEFRGRIGYEENSAADTNILEVIAILTLFHREYDKPGKAPTVAYSSKGRLDKRLLDDDLAPGYKALAPLVCDILKLHDHVYANFDAKYKEAFPNGRLGRRGETGNRIFPANRRVLPLTGKESKYTIPLGALYPLLAGFRGLVKYNTKGQATWYSDPFEFFTRHGASLVENLVDQLEVVGDNPQTLGKTKTVYTALHNQVRLLVLDKIAD